MHNSVLIDGNRAAAEGICLARPHVISVYPITPQTPVITHLNRMITEGQLNCRYVQVESEHSAMSVCDGATAAGVRSFTATSSQGLLYMFEMIYMVAGQRLPIVMYVVNRTLAMPTTLMPEHNDALSTRDCGWLQVHCETAQEVLDFSLLAYKIAENKQVLLPFMYCADGFQLSHTEEVVHLPLEKEVRRFLPPYDPEHVYLRQDDPMFIGIASKEMNLTEYRYNMNRAMEASKKVILQAGEEFGTYFGRTYGLLDLYRMENAEIAIIVIGSMAGTIRAAIDQLRTDGIPVGMIKLWFVRPFPSEQLYEAAKSVKLLLVIERSTSIGSVRQSGCLYPEITAAFYHKEHQPYIQPYVAGLAARKAGVEDFRQVVMNAWKQAGQGNSDSAASWVNLVCPRKGSEYAE